MNITPTKHCILGIYEQMTHYLATGTEYRSALNPPPSPPCDKYGVYIPVSQWDIIDWPKHVHQMKEEYER